MSYCDLEPARAWSFVEPTAIKTHRCCECKAPILPGEKYLRVGMCWDGTAETFKQHLLCAELCETVRDKIFDDGCLPFGGFKEWWRDDGRHENKKSDGYNRVRTLYARVLRLERKFRG